MADKDRFGERMREAERGREEQYFAQRDRELLEKLRGSKKGDQAETEIRELAKMRCPKCGARLVERKLSGVDVDECEECKGMWLDRGELKQLRDQGWLSRWIRGEFDR